MTDMSVGNCIAAPTCTKVIPIYPVRYAVMPADSAGYRYGKGSNLDTQFPDLPETNYCLRNLRDETYVYIYDPASREKWFCYQYNRKGMPGFQTMRIDDKDASLRKSFSPPSAGIEYSVHFHKATKIYMINIDSPLTKDTMKKVEGGELRSKIMQEIDVGTWFGAYEAHWQAKKEILRDPPKVKHIINSFNHISWNVDFDKKFKSAWSENTADTKSPQDAISSVVKKAGVMEGAFVALYDAVGIASELSHLVEFEVEQIKANSELTARKQWVSDMIDKLTKAAGQKAYNEAYATDGTNVVYGGTSHVYGGGASLRARTSRMKAQEKARDGRVEDYNKSNQFHKRKKFIADLPAERQRIHAQIQAAGEPHIKFVKYKGPGNFNDTLEAYDVLDDDGFLAYQGAVARSVDGLRATDEGSNYLAAMLPASGPTGIFEKALQGHPSVLAYIETQKNIMGVGTKFINDKLKALGELPVQATPASKHLSLIATSVLIQYNRFKDFEVFLISKYRTILEVAEGNVISKGKFLLKDLPGLMFKATTSRETTFVFRPTSPSSTGTTVTASTSSSKSLDLYYLGGSDNPYLQTDLAATQNKAKYKLNFWHNIKISVSGLGTALAAFNIAKTLQEYKDEDKSALMTSLTLAANLMGGTAATASMKQVWFEKRKALAVSAETKTAAKTVADGAERFAMSLAIAASITSFITISIKAVKSKSTTSKVLYTGSVFTHGVATSFAIYQFMATSKNANMVNIASKLGSVISKTMPFRAASLLGPKGILIMLAVEAIAYALEKWAEANERDKELDWIEQSIWGTEPNPQWTWEKERYQILKMFMKPKVDYTAERLMNREDITVVLPGYQPQVSDVEIYKSGKLLTKDKYGNVLKPQIKDKYGSRIIQYKKIEYLGVVNVIYWPNRFADPETYYKADTNMIFTADDPYEAAKRRKNLDRLLGKE